jgi:hypothetical protein
MAWWTVSGAGSSRSERRTLRRPSRRRMVVLREVKRRKRMSSAGMGARGRSSRYSCSKMAMSEVGAGDFFARGLLGLGGWSVVAGNSWKSVGGGAGDGEKSCRNCRRGDGPGCFGVVRVGPCFWLPVSLAFWPLQE